jgi:hypothetical protein
MSNAARIVLVVLGVLLLVLIVFPLLFMGGMMGAMMGGGGMTWGTVGLALVALLAGVALIVVGLRGRT